MNDGCYILDTDASNFAIGAVLSQMQNGEERIIAYASKTLERARQNYCTTKKELYAVTVVNFVEHFRYYLYGRHFIVRSDHASLKWLKNFRNIEGMLARWLATLETYDFEILHRKGTLNGNADGMSRIPTRKCPRSDCPQCTQIVSAVDTQGESSEKADSELESANGQDEWLRGWTTDDLRHWEKSDVNMNRTIE